MKKQIKFQKREQQMDSSTKQKLTREQQKLEDDWAKEELEDYYPDSQHSTLGR